MSSDIEDLVFVRAVATLRRLGAGEKRRYFWEKKSTIFNFLKISGGHHFFCWCELRTQGLSSKWGSKKNEILQQQKFFLAHSPIFDRSPPASTPLHRPWMNNMVFSFLIHFRFRFSRKKNSNFSNFFLDPFENFFTKFPRTIFLIIGEASYPRFETSLLLENPIIYFDQGRSACWLSALNPSTLILNPNKFYVIDRNLCFIKFWRSDFNRVRW
jgi:hypothetical protein